MDLIEYLPRNIKISDPFWDTWVKINQDQAIFHQLEMLEKVGSIDNFRLVAGLKDGFRHGFFYTDSDVYKWVEAASWILGSNPSNLILETKLNEIISIIEKAQRADGYLFTYNQFHFPGRMWANLSIEHELYCLGHLIEAGIAHRYYRKDSILFKCAIKAADLLVEVFLKQKLPGTPGHPEIELALLKLHEITRNPEYFRLAELFIIRRGKTPLFGFKLMKQNSDQMKREKIIAEKRKEYQQRKYQEPNNIVNDSQEDFGFLETMEQEERRKYLLRALYQFFTGKYFQENKPFHQRIKPEGHAVRFGYFQAAVTKYLGEIQNLSVLETVEQCWDKTISEFMYVTGGLGALPLIEGFGRCFELPNDSAYCETCAAIASILWTWELFKITHRPDMLEVMELQLYNAMLVGMGADGKSYFYRNVLESAGKINRKPWYKTPCCPSNISRIIAQLGKFCYFGTPHKLYITQYFGNTAEIVIPSVEKSPEIKVKIQMDVDIFQNNSISIKFQLDQPSQFTLMLRVPSWFSEFTVWVDGKKAEPSDSKNIFNNPKNFSKSTIKSASGLDFQGSYWFPIEKLWDRNNGVSIQMSISTEKLKPHKKLKHISRHIAFKRGPLIYCLESTENPEIDINQFFLPPKIRIDLAKDSNIIGGIPKLFLNHDKNRVLRLIPYFFWGNRGPSRMKVWLPKESKYIIGSKKSIKF